MARPSRDPEAITREVDAVVKVREVEEMANLREAVSFGWGEMLLLAGVFCFALGVMVTLVYALPSDNQPLYRFMLLWSGGFVLMCIGTLDFLVRKFRALRRMNEIALRRIEKLERALARQRSLPTEDKKP